MMVADLLIVVGYFLFMLFLGWRSRRQSAESYWVAERRYGTARISMSLVATIFGASSTMGMIGLGYTRGLTAAWWSLMGGLALIPCGLLLAARVRGLSVYTLPDILKKAYGERVAVPAGAMIAVAWCGVIAAQLIAGGGLLSGLLGLHPDLSLALVAVVFTAYTFWGGQLSVIRTDAWQLGIFAGGLGIAFSFLLTGGGSGVLPWEGVPPSHWHFPVSEAFGAYELLVFYPLILGLPYLVGPDIYSRILCARDPASATRAVLVAALMVIPLSLLLAFFGVAARAYFPGIPPESALPKTLTELMPWGLRGLAVAGFLAAVMSSADTCLISASTILTLNVIQPLGHIPEGRRHSVSRAAVLCLGVAAYGIGRFQPGIIASLILGYTVFVGGVVAPTLASFFPGRWKPSPGAAFWAVVVGGTVATLGGIRGGTLLQALIPKGGQTVLGMLLGPKYLSILPIILSAAILFAAGIRRRA